MAHATTSHALHAQRGGLVARLAAALASHRAYVAIRGELSALSDRDLLDIGLSRHSIGDVAHAAVYHHY